MAGDSKPRRVGIIGFGHLGQYLTARIEEEGCGHGLELAFVWNRSREKMEGRVRREQQLPSLSDAVHRRADLVVEVAHPQITKEHGAEILKHADFMVGSPTAFADPEVEAACREAARRHGHTLYLPSGALWGAADIQRMADSGALQALKVTMSKHPDSFRLQGAVGARGQSRGERAVLYQGPVRALCPLAPNNVNTMAAAAMAAHNLGFDRVQGCLVSDPSLSDWHVVEVEVTGRVDEASGHGFTVKTTRRNPAAPGAVTGSATYASFWSSLLSCKGHGGKLFLC